jgi:putative tryptophan/tyrosine transport system substrate-binding protein
MAIHIRRREFITLLGGVVAWPLVAHAQQQAKTPRIGILGLLPISGFASRFDAFRAGLRDLGYVEGDNLVLEFRWAERPDDLPKLATELVDMNVDVIFAPSSIQVKPAQRATKTIPIVFATHADPVGLGHVASLARPGANITGLSMMLTELAAKQLEISKEVMPHATRVGVLWDSMTPSHALALEAIEAAAKTLGVTLQMVSATNIEEFDPAFMTMSNGHVDCFIAVPAAFANSYRTSLADLSLKYRLAGIFQQKMSVEAGGFMSYGADTLDLYRRAAWYIDRILKGVKPADFPVQQPTKFELVINLKTAKALGITIPPTLLARADEVIE